MEYILCASILYHNDKLTPVHRPINVDSGIVFSGHRHCHCIGLAVSLLYPDWTNNEEHDKNRLHFLKNQTQGFLTNLNRFVDRKEALQIALKAGQADKNKLGNEKIGLFSEDLY